MLNIEDNPAKQIFDIALQKQMVICQRHAECYVQTMKHLPISEACEEQEGIEMRAKISQAERNEKNAADHLDFLQQSCLHVTKMVSGTFRWATGLNQEEWDTSL